MELNKKNTDLLILLKEGDIMAFDTIFNMYCGKLHDFVLRYLKQEEDTEEIVQEVFIKIWEKRTKINIYSSFESYFFTMAYNETISLLRKRVSEKKSFEYLKSVQDFNTAENVIDELHYKDLKNKLDSLLNQLTSRQKEIYILSREEGLTHREIAFKLNISKNTVKNHLVSSLKFIRKNMDNSLVTSILFLSLFL